MKSKDQLEDKFLEWNKLARRTLVHLPALELGRKERDNIIGILKPVQEIVPIPLFSIPFYFLDPALNRCKK